MLRGDAWLEASNFPRQLWDLTSDELEKLREEGRVQKQAMLGWVLWSDLTGCVCVWHNGVYTVKWLPRMKTGGAPLYVNMVNDLFLVRY